MRARQQKTEWDWNITIFEWETRKKVRDGLHCPASGPLSVLFGAMSDSSSGDDSDGDRSQVAKSQKRSSSFQLNDAFTFDLGGSAAGGPRHAWNFADLRKGGDPQRGANSTTVHEKIEKLIKRKEMRQHNLAAAERLAQSSSTWHFFCLAGFLLRGNGRQTKQSPHTHVRW